MRKRILPAVLSIVLLLAALILAQAVLIPSRYDNREGHLLCGYYGATDKHDVIFVVTARSTRASCPPCCMKNTA